MEQIAVEELHRRFKAQGVSAREHIAVKCPICGTVQSLTSLARAGVPEDKHENYIGFSCVGRFTNAGEWKKGEPPGRGCNWTLGGLFKLHKLEVINAKGEPQPYFEIATAEEAQALEKQHATAAQSPANAA
jgi:hypothetical protein